MPGAGCGAASRCSGGRPGRREGQAVTTEKTWSTRRQQHWKKTSAAPLPTHVP